jgi:hypothetical protein
MDTAFDYLREVHGDLLAAAVRERARRRRPRFPARASRFLVPAAAFIVVAGILGALIRTGTLGSDEAQETAGPAEGLAGSTGETGAAGGAADEGRTAPTLMPDVRGGLEIPASVAAGELSRVIRTAEIGVVIERDSLDDRFADVIEIAETSGGFVARSTARERSGRLTVRVPADRFNATLASLRDLGEVEVQTVGGQDVTAEFIDLQARIRIAEARREVLLVLMERATTIQQTIRVQNALDDTQLRIEGLQGQLRLLDDRTSLATIQLAMREEGVQSEVQEASLANALERSVAGFIAVIAAIVVGAGYLLPLVAIALTIWLVVVLVRRRRETT